MFFGQIRHLPIPHSVKPAAHHHTNSYVCLIQRDTNLISTVNHSGGRLMIWACFAEPGLLTVIKLTINSVDQWMMKCEDILQLKLGPYWTMIPNTAQGAQMSCGYCDFRWSSQLLHALGCRSGKQTMAERQGERRLILVVFFFFIVFCLLFYIKTFSFFLSFLLLPHSF